MLFDAASVWSFKQYARKSARPYSPRIAMATLYLLSGQSAPWINRQEQYRLHKRLETVDAPTLVWQTRRRAQLHEYWVRDAFLEQVASELRISAASGELAENFELVPTSVIEGYASVEQAKLLVERLRMKEGASPAKVRLRTAAYWPEGEGPMPVAVRAVDLAESLNPRERRAGEQRLVDLLAGYKN
ncbi:hypothetical protein KIMH_13060 [Bombiscardovia apis]|uniref:Uncharacterized protein n=1 Tax=Bombiscardovia apis TaxID=2932182 RepID=A0ABM8BE57_9BIFI|nr:hypothetical protein KIMH_13060 [Bombiscardovia apis]